MRVTRRIKWRKMYYGTARSNEMEITTKKRVLATLLIYAFADKIELSWVKIRSRLQVTHSYQA